MLFSKKALVAATTLLFASPVIEGKFLCCPNDDDVDNEYFDECEGCYTVPSKNAKEQSITGEASCLDALFVNYPGYPTRRLEELDLNFLPSALAKEARIVELDSGRQIIELSDGRHLVPFPDDLPKNHRALQGWDNPEWPPTYPMYPGKVVAYSLCEDTKNDLCCCDSSPYLYPVYKECEQACYFYEPDECQALELGTAVPAGPLNFSPDCLGTWRAEKCKPGMGLGGADPHFRVCPVLPCHES